ncbi:hypothetical protein HAX54_040749 [Datura stramonium]|uniref:Uncharacterized protein n=1 Tax=Datura stramonium TaxID=4076 RepID=A0ABS8RNC1_DATST|nr:hypothetical protein [Datura stramonium]
MHILRRYLSKVLPRGVLWWKHLEAGDIGEVIIDEGIGEAIDILFIGIDALIERYSLRDLFVVSVEEKTGYTLEKTSLVKDLEKEPTILDPVEKNEEILASRSWSLRAYPDGVTKGVTDVELPTVAPSTLVTVMYHRSSNGLRGIRCRTLFVSPLFFQFTDGSALNFVNILVTTSLFGNTIGSSW